MKFRVEDQDIYVDHLGKWNNASWDEKTTVIWGTHRKLLCSAWAIIFHHECMLNVKLELNFIKVSYNISNDIVEDMLKLFEDYGEVDKNFSLFKDELDHLLHNIKDCKHEIEYPPADPLNSKDKIPHCLRLMKLILNSQAYNFLQ